MSVLSAAWTVLSFVFIVLGGLKLVRLNAAALKLEGNNPDGIELWRFYRQRQYLWLIAAGWGTFILKIPLVIALSGLDRLGIGRFGQEVTDWALRIAWVITSMVVSRNAGKQGDKIEALLPGGYPSQSLRRRTLLATLSLRISLVGAVLFLIGFLERTFSLGFVHGLDFGNMSPIEALGEVFGGLSAFVLALIAVIQKDGPKNRAVAAMVASLVLLLLPVPIVGLALLIASGNR